MVGKEKIQAQTPACVLASVWVHVCVRGVGVCMRFHVLIYVNWKKHFMKMCGCGATGVSVLVCMQGDGFGVFLHSFVFESNIVT